MKVNNIYNADCIEGMKSIPDNSVDMILTDLPYGVTECEWDNVIPFAPLWEQYNRVAKERAAIVLFSIQPFTTKLINSNLKSFRYCWYWKKNNVTGAPFAKVQPMRCIEDICVFHADGNAGQHEALRKYFFDELQKSGRTRTDIDKLLKNSMSSHYFTYGKQFTIPSKKDYEKLQSTGYFSRPYEDIKKEFATARKSATYNPQGLKRLEKAIVRTEKKKSNVYTMRTNKQIYKQLYTNYPVHLLEFKNDAANNRNRLHPTQKPLALCEYLIKTYTNEGETVLDSCAGSGTTLLAAKQSGRQYIGFEIDKKYYDIAVERLSTPDM